jgi:hypothetical protein
MQRFVTIATACILSLALTALGGRGDHKQSKSTKGTGGNTSKGTPQGSGGTSKQHLDKKTEQHTIKQTQMHMPKNPNLANTKPPNKLQPFIKPLKGVANNKRVDPGARSAINSVLDGNFLDANGRQDLNNLLAGNPAGLNEDELKAVQAVLDYDALAKKEERYIKVENASGERITLWLHYQALADKDEWEWLPVKPVDPEKALRFDLEPNSTAYLSDGKTRIAAGRARLWAESQSGYKWTGYRDEDLKLKPADRKAVSEMETYTLRLVSAENMQTQARK